MKITPLPIKQIVPPQLAPAEIKLRLALLISASLEHFHAPDSNKTTYDPSLLGENANKEQR